MAAITSAGTAIPNYSANALRSRLGRYATMGFLFLIAIFTLLPFVWVVSTSLRTPAQSFTEPPKWIPSDLAFENYSEVFDQIPFWNQLLNSFIITLSVVAGQVITASLAGYAFARLKFPG